MTGGHRAAASPPGTGAAATRGGWRIAEDGRSRRRPAKLGASFPDHGPSAHRAAVLLARDARGGESRQRAAGDARELAEIVVELARIAIHELQLARELIQPLCEVILGRLVAERGELRHRFEEVALEAGELLPKSHPAP